MSEATLYGIGGPALFYVSSSLIYDHEEEVHGICGFAPHNWRGFQNRCDLHRHTLHASTTHSLSVLTERAGMIPGYDRGDGWCGR